MVTSVENDIPHVTVNILETPTKFISFNIVGAIHCDISMWIYKFSGTYK